MRSAARSRGQSLIEFAIALPVLIALFSGTLDLGRVYYFQILTRDAARDGARELIGNYGSTSPTAATICTQVTYDLKNAASSSCSEILKAPPYSAGTDYTAPSSGQVVVLVYCGTPTTSACGTSTGGNKHATVSVWVYYGFSTLTPLITELVGSNGIIQLSSGAQMVSNW